MVVKADPVNHLEDLRTALRAQQGVVARLEERSSRALADVGAAENRLRELGFDLTKPLDTQYAKLVAEVDDLAQQAQTAIKNLLELLGD